MKNNKLKEVEKRYRELGVEGDDVFTLIASEYIRFHKLELSERLIGIIKKADEINCNGNSQKMESIAKRVVRYDKLAKKLPILYQFFHSKRFRDNTGKFFTPRNIARSMAEVIDPKNDVLLVAAVQLREVDSFCSPYIVDLAVLSIVECQMLKYICNIFKYGQR